MPLEVIMAAIEGVAPSRDELIPWGAEPAGFTLFKRNMHELLRPQSFAGSWQASMLVTSLIAVDQEGGRVARMLLRFPTRVRR